MTFLSLSFSLSISLPVDPLPFTYTYLHQCIYSNEQADCPTFDYILLLLWWWWYGKFRAHSAHSFPNQNPTTKKWLTDKKSRFSIGFSSKTSMFLNEFYLNAMLSWFYCLCWKLQKVFVIQFNFGEIIIIGYWLEIAPKIDSLFTRYSSAFFFSSVPKFRSNDTVFFLFA